MSWWSEFKQHYLVKFWSPIPAVIALGILSTYYFGLLGTFWAVTGEFTRWGGHLAQLFGANPAEWTYLKILGFKGTPWDRIDGVMIIGMFAGALAAALWADNVKLRLPSTRIRIFQALIGGIIAGGCETGWMYRAMEGQIHFWWVGIGNVLGSLLLALCWDSLAPSLVYGYEKINMLKLFGTYGGLYVNYALMAVSFAFVVWWERRFLAKKSQYQNNHI